MKKPSVLRHWTKKLLAVDTWILVAGANPGCTMKAWNEATLISKCFIESASSSLTDLTLLWEMYENEKFLLPVSPC